MKRFFPLLIAALMPLAAKAGNVDTFGIGAKATALGGAFSAYADDPFAVYYNPAGLTQIDSPTISIGGELLNPTLKVHNFKATDGNGVKVEPYDISFKDTSDNLFVPHVGYATPLFKNVYFGIAAYIPYGLHIKWNSNTAENPAAYNGFESYYLRGVVTPTVAVRLSEKLSVGFGISFGRSDAGTQRRIYAPTIPSLHNRIIKGELSDDFNISFNVGILYKPYDNLSFGLTYRSRTQTDFEGTVEVVGVDKVHATTEIDHPEQLQAGVMYRPNKRLTLTADVVWTNWSIIDGYTVRFDRELLGEKEEVFPRNWKDTRQVRIGIEYKLSEIVTLRGGYFYDPSPIPDSTFDMLWPDADKKTYSFGLGLNFGRLSVDTVLQYIIAEYKREIGGESVELNESYAGSTGEPGTVAMSADGHLWGYGITVNYRF
ncbi:OmpP1/FadL family transporter [Phorcysia thermohydrogeniphila]|uniref:Long-chain fatty acid transport protein n=1 Tax=Phorcysia thermohydrogeniphila TaxID=936138 RepID=A0A4R1G9L2_9BACT|nr:outer membrane protein transport protein [Phorcysia thermohydrogeniphila]TCK03331.1 long-chain fatty acid transport protein [Phorcysia thermohydrogeniphila]